PGTITAGLAQLVPEGSVIGLDLAKAVLVEAGAEAGRRGLTNATFEIGDVYHLPFDDGSFDVVHAHQLLQHLADPVAALAEMRRVRRTGGLVAARDGDYGAMSWFPEDPELDEWQTLYRSVARAIGGEPDAGRRMLAWARAAGFAEVEMSAGTWCFVSDRDRTWWGALWADRLTQSSFAAHALGHELATRPDLERLAGAWRRWTAAADASFLAPNGEVLCRG
ncbi:MAG: methyltransferase domain-containing protein, partial [Acidimicrobiales bacterium]